MNFLVLSPPQRNYKYATDSTLVNTVHKNIMYIYIFFIRQSKNSISSKITVIYNLTPPHRRKVSIRPRSNLTPQQRLQSTDPGRFVLFAKNEYLHRDYYWNFRDIREKLENITASTPNVSLFLRGFGCFLSSHARETRQHRPRRFRRRSCRNTDFMTFWNKWERNFRIFRIARYDPCLSVLFLYFFVKGILYCFGFDTNGCIIPWSYRVAKSFVRLMHASLIDIIVIIV